MIDPKTFQDALARLEAACARLPARLLRTARVCRLAAALEDAQPIAAPCEKCAVPVWSEDLLETSDRDLVCAECAAIAALEE